MVKSKSISLWKVDSTLTDSPKDPLEDIRKAMIQLQSLAQPIIDIQNQMTEAMKPFVNLTPGIQ